MTDLTKLIYKKSIYIQREEVLFIKNVYGFTVK